MNIYDHIGNLLIDLNVLPDHEQGVAAEKIDVALDWVGAWLAQYDALAPDWTKAPDDAQVYAIDADELAHWFVAGHNVYTHELSYWSGKRVSPNVIMRVTLPIGIDWRLCKWQRPEEA